MGTDGDRKEELSQKGGGGIRKRVGRSQQRDSLRGGRWVAEE